MVKKKGLKKFNISNKLAYTLMVILSIALLGIGVYAFSSDPTAGNPSVMGHSLGEILWPTTCTSTQVLGVNAAGDAVCVTPVDSRFTITTSGLCYTAPATCAIAQQFCAGSYDFVRPLGTTCLDNPTSLQGYAENTCLNYAEVNSPAICDGDTTPQCSSCDGACEVYPDYCTATCATSTSVACSCKSSFTNPVEIYTPAGQRCI